MPVAYTGYDLGLKGLGDVCGPNQCSWYDWIWTTDSCLNYLNCANPSDPRAVAMNQSVLTAVSQGAGSMVGSAAGEIVGGVATGVGTGVTSGLVNSTDYTGVITLLAAGLLGVIVLEKLVRL